MWWRSKSRERSFHQASPITTYERLAARSDPNRSIAEDVYSWTRLCPLSAIRVVVIGTCWPLHDSAHLADWWNYGRCLGQDPYHVRPASILQNAVAEPLVTGRRTGARTFSYHALMTLVTHLPPLLVRIGPRLFRPQGGPHAAVLEEYIQGDRGRDWRVQTACTWVRRSLLLPTGDYWLTACVVAGILRVGRDRGCYS